MLKLGSSLFLLYRLTTNSRVTNIWWLKVALASAITLSGSVVRTPSVGEELPEDVEVGASLQPMFVGLRI